ncbi:MAG: imidazole glycerol phosphate synthase subunit HisF [Bacteroidota bacterium]
MLTRRIIPCLDVLRGRVVKGRRFKNLFDAGDPVELASLYSRSGADEIVVLDISATLEERKPFFEIVTKIAKEVAIPLTVGGGIRALDDIVNVLHCGADKVSLNTILTQNPNLLGEAVDRVGSQALVAAIDAKRNNRGWIIHTRSGTTETVIDAVEWAKKVVGQGAGEILVTSIDNDGMKGGYDTELLKALSSAVKVPIVASGGAGTMEHMFEALSQGCADAVLAASIFHFHEIEIPTLKHFLLAKGLPIRI